MNETVDNKINIVQCRIKQDGYEEAIGTLIKADEKRKDSFSDKPLYILEDVNISNNIYAVTPSVTEALNRSPRKSIGIMNTNGDLLVSIVNSEIKKVNDKYISVKTSSNLEEMEAMKSDPTKVQENAEISQQIKNKILAIDSNVRFVCDDYYGTYDLYEINNNNLNKVCDNVSYIAVNGDVVYAQTNKVDEEVQVINKEIEDPNVTMPVGVLADVTNKPFDNLEVEDNMDEVKDGAPDLVNEESKGEAFNIDEIQSELSGINNDIETPVKLTTTDTSMPIEPNFSEEKIDIPEVDDFKGESFDVPGVDSFKEEVSNIPVEEKEEITEVKENVFKKEEKEKDYERNYDFAPKEKSSDDIYGLVRSLKIKLVQSADDDKKIQELEEQKLELKNENSELKNDNSDLKREISELKNDNHQLINDSVDLKHENSELKNENRDLKQEVSEVKEENSELMKEIERKNRENIELRRSLKESNKQVEMFYKELVGFIDGDSEQKYKFKGQKVA